MAQKNPAQDAISAAMSAIEDALNLRPPTAAADAPRRRFADSSSKALPAAPTLKARPGAGRGADAASPADSGRPGAGARGYRPQRPSQTVLAGGAPPPTTTAPSVGADLQALQVKPADARPSCSPRWSARWSGWRSAASTSPAISRWSLGAAIACART